MIKRLLFVMLAVTLFVPAIVQGSTNPVVYDDWQSGNAEFECSQIGEYEYAFKVDDAAPNNSWVWEGNTITIYGSDGSVFNWSATNPIGAVIVKAGTGANVWFYSPQVLGDTGLYGYENREISHVTFCWNPEQVYEGEWCSPGYWRQTHHLDSWLETGYEPEDLFFDVFGYYPTLSKLGQGSDATTDPTLWEVLQSPQWYGGRAFNAIGDLLSEAHPDVNFMGTRVEDSCPLN
ncbi:hypothetical protein K0B04_03920 [Patescibacteria group bacterium]|nr:hypothetical protein [Patescibacteria group bacterium]